MARGHLGSTCGTPGSLRAELLSNTPWSGNAVGLGCTGGKGPGLVWGPAAAGLCRAPAEGRGEHRHKEGRHWQVQTRFSGELPLYGSGAGTTRSTHLQKGTAVTGARSYNTAGRKLSVAETDSQQRGEFFIQCPPAPLQRTVLHSVGSWHRAAPSCHRPTRARSPAGPSLLCSWSAGPHPNLGSLFLRQL